ncbi:MAG: SDR family NAD(P)-dependent oxidoreductase [Thermodesulfobacteriota bacterium]
MELTGLADKTALVTGASRGIGRAIAVVLAQAGARVVCCARSQEQLQELCAQIRAQGGQALAAPADVAQPQDRRRVIEQAAGAWGSLDILVNNAGIHAEKPALELSDQELSRVMEVNFFSMFALARDAAPHMIKAGGGRIVNMGSFWGQKGVSRQLPYCVSKTAVEAMTRCLAVEWARYNIQVNTVAPGHILTEISKPALEDEKIGKDILRRIPARRVGEAEEVAYLTAFLCSDQARYLTGHLYYIDGGQAIAW